MNRREFLAAATGATLAGRWAWAEVLPRDVRITRITSLDLLTQRPKYVGKNSRRDDHGRNAHERLIRIQTSAGIEGLATSWDTREHCAEMLGKSLADFYRPDERRMVGPFNRYTSPLWDLAGKVLGKPVYELLGGRGPKRVPVYDGSIYFVDLLPEHARDWPDAFRRELDSGMKLGHRMFKIKIGRGSKWMPTEDGFERDINVLGVIRRHVGPEILLAVDANEGYDLDRTKKLLGEMPRFKFEFLEQMFPADVAKYLDLKAFIRDAGHATLIADGEGTRRPEQYKPWIEARAVDILQGDMNLYGFEDVLAGAEMGRPHSIRVAPHNWGSLVGYYLQLHVGRAITNFYRAEHDPMSSPALIAEGYDLADGTASVSDAPGLGLRLDERKLETSTKLIFDLKA